MRASSPAPSPPTLTGSCSVVLGRISDGAAFRSTASVFARAIDGKPLHADGAARHALRRRIERPAQGRDQIGAGAPITADRQLHLGGARFHVARLAGDELVADDVEGEPPGIARGHRDRHGVARLVFALVERDFEHVGRVGIRFDIKAGVERDGRERTVRIGARHFEPVAAEIHRHGDARRLVGARRRSCRRRRAWWS